jgi:hypothetical protein
MNEHVQVCRRANELLGAGDFELAVDQMKAVGLFTMGVSPAHLTPRAARATAEQIENALGELQELVATFAPRWEQARELLIELVAELEAEELAAREAAERARYDEAVNDEVTRRHAAAERERVAAEKAAIRDELTGAGR